MQDIQSKENMRLAHKFQKYVFFLIVGERQMKLKLRSHFTLNRPKKKKICPKAKSNGNCHSLSQGMKINAIAVGRCLHYSMRGGRQEAEMTHPQTL